MNPTLVKLALGTLTLTTNCTTTTNSWETHESQKVAQIDNTPTIAAIGDVRIDGSSTVYRITQAIAKAYVSKQKKKISVNISRTSGGFEKFCAGQTNPWAAKNKQAVYKFVNFYIDRVRKVASSVSYVS
jgi:phosphate transport system substrate-binding protein